MRTDRWNSAILRQRTECSETIQLIDRIKVSFLGRTPQTEILAEIATLGCHGVLARFRFPSTRCDPESSRTPLLQLL